MQRRWLFVAFQGCLALGCGEDSAERAMPDRSAFEALVAASNQCQQDSECTIVGDGCAALCGVSVNVARASEVKAAAMHLNRQYANLGDGTGTQCNGLCQTQEPHCDVERCSIRAALE